MRKRSRCALLGAVVVSAVLGMETRTARAAHIFTPGDPILAIDPDPGPPASSPVGEEVDKVIDGLTTTKYLNFGREGAGFIVTPGAPSVVKSFVLTTGNDAPERDPVTYQLFGTNSPITSAPFSTGAAEPWTLISSGGTNLGTDPGRTVVAPPVDVGGNTTSYSSYKMIFPTVRDHANANSMQVTEAQLFTATAGAGSPILAPGNPTVALDLPGIESRYPTGQEPARAIDGDLSATSKYLNFGRQNSGFIITPSTGATIARSFRITTANDVPTRDPTSYEIWGHNGPITATDNGTGLEDSWTLIASGPLTLPAGRNTTSDLIVFANSTAYTSYKIDFPTNAGSGTATQFAEFDLQDTVPEPAGLALIAASALIVLRRRGSVRK
jgi:hypothetical protein